MCRAPGQEESLSATAKSSPTGIQSAYGGASSVRGVDMLTLTTGSDNDRIITRAENHRDVLATGAGDDVVKVADGRDDVHMGDGPTL